jgi:dihydroneopterin aldolase
MLTVSIHGIQLHAYVGLYPEEKVTGNNFEIDVDVLVRTEEADAFPFIDYSVIHQIVSEIFRQPGDLLESYVKEIHTSLREAFPEAEKIKVAVRKLQPPLGGDVRYAQVCYEA